MSAQAPPPEAPFADKLAYYRGEHTSRGVNVTHLIGTPVITFGIPLLFAKPKLGVPMFVGGWALQILGHKVFEHNLPSTHKGPITYQLTGVVHVCEMYGEMLARRSQRKARPQAGLDGEPPPAHSGADGREPAAAAA